DPTLLERSIRYTLQQKRHEAELDLEVRKRTAELARANEALKEADRRKNEFLATLAHELRNPLAPISNSLEIMRLASDAPSLDSARTILERQVKQMVRLIEDLLDVSRITRNKLELRKEPVEVGAVVEQALEISRPQLEKAEVALDVRVEAAQVVLDAD